MDTLDELHGTYFFDGMSLTKDERLFWLILGEISVVKVDNFFLLKSTYLFNTVDAWKFRYLN